MLICRFAGVGAVVFVLELCVYSLLRWAMAPIPARLLALATAVLLAWALHQRVTFRATQHGRSWALQGRSLLRFITGSLAGLCVNAGCFAMLQSWWALPRAVEGLALLPGILLGAVVNYGACKYWVFSNKSAS